MERKCRTGYKNKLLYIKDFFKKRTYKVIKPYFQLIDDTRSQLRYKKWKNEVNENKKN